MDGVIKVPLGNLPQRFDMYTPGFWF